ncbi:MAG: hypothetical protein ACE5IL_02715 [Myxococcota bacterium]
MVLPPDDSTPSSPEDASWVRSHPVMVLLSAACTGIGLGLGVALLPGDWSLLHRSAAGAVGGAGVALLVLATRLIA